GAPPQRQEGEAGRVERVVHAEENQRQQQPADGQHRSGEGGGQHPGVEVVEHPGQREQDHPAEGPAGAEENPQAEDQGPPPARQAGVAPDPVLESDKVPDGHPAYAGLGDAAVDYSHASSSPVVVRPPTTSTKTSSSDRSPRTSSNVPARLMTPSARIATWLQSRSTTSITWLEKMTVPPPA